MFAGTASFFSMVECRCTIALTALVRFAGRFVIYNYWNTQSAMRSVCLSVCLSVWWILLNEWFPSALLTALRGQ